MNCRAVPKNTPAPAAAASAAPVRKLNVASSTSNQRGLMQKFLASHGKITHMATPLTFSAPTVASKSGVAAPAPSVAKPLQVQPTFTAPVQEIKMASASATAPSGAPRRHLATTEEKIQQEFREMKKREEELKLNRMKMLAKSQPNLLASLQQEEEEAAGAATAGEGHKGHKGHQDREDQDSYNLNSVNQLRGALSVHNLLDEGAKVKAGRRKSALVAHWENRIQHQEF